MGSPSDEEHCKKISKSCKDFGLQCILRCTSAHKTTNDALKVLAEYEGKYFVIHIYLCGWLVYCS